MLLGAVASLAVVLILAVLSSGRLDAVGDTPTRLLRRMCRLLPEHRAEWGEAMCQEAAVLEGRAARWRYALGCAGAIVATPLRPTDRGRALVVMVVVLPIGCGALVGGAFVRYPYLPRDGRTAVSLLALAALLSCYAVGSVAVARRWSPSTTLVVGSGIGVAGVWIGIGLSASAVLPAALSGVLTVIAVLVPLVVGAVATRRAGSAAAGRATVLLTAVIAGLTVFLGWVGETVLAAGRPYDAGMVRDFHTSGAHDLATYAVNDSVGSAMSLLLLIPVLTAAVGLLGASAYRRRRPR